MKGLTSATDGMTTETTRVKTGVLSKPLVGFQGVLPGRRCGRARREACFRVCRTVTSRTVGMSALVATAGASGALLVLAPHGRGGAVIVSVLVKAGVRAEAVAGLQGLMARIDGTPAVVVAVEALTGPAVPELLAWVGRQPPWSNLAFIVLVARQAAAQRSRRALVIEGLGNATLMEQPLNAESLLSAARSAMRARGRQLAMRDLALSLDVRVQERTWALTESETWFRAVFEGFPACLFVVRVLEGDNSGGGDESRDFEY